MLGKFMFLGHTGEYGKYQLVENQADVTEGYEPIVIEASDDASQLAQKIRNAIGDLEKFNVSYDGEIVTIKEKQNQGEHSMPVSFSSQEPDEYDVYRGLFNASTGIIDVTLFWDKQGDLDLHCLTPSGKHIYYAVKGASVDGGILEFDNIPGSTDGSIVAEHIYFPDSDDLIEDGEYTFWVRNYNSSATPESGVVALQIKMGDEVEKHSQGNDPVIFVESINNPLYQLAPESNPGVFKEGARTGTLPARDSLPFTTTYTGSWTGPKVISKNGVTATVGYSIPENLGTPAKTTVDFADSTLGNLLGGTMVVSSSNGREKYQFVLHSGDAEAGYTPIELPVSLLSADDEDRADAIAEQVRSSLHEISGFNFDVSNGKLSITEAVNQGKKAVSVNFLPPGESDDPVSEPEMETEIGPDNSNPDNLSPNW